MKRILIAFLLLISLKGFSQSSPFGVYYASKFGCIPDGKVIQAAASMTLGSATLTSSVATFVVADIGKSVRVQGAGTSNADFYATISAFTSSTVVTLSSNAISTVSAKNLDYGTDNTSRIQNFFIFLQSVGGGKALFQRGMYQMYGALQTSVNSVNPNCQVYFPLTNVTSLPVAQIEVVGEFANQLLIPIIASGFGNIQQKCTIFKSEITGSGTNPAVFGTPYYIPVYSGANYNFTSVRMSNIVIQTKSQTNNVEIAGTMCGINANYLNQFSIENSIVATESILYSTATQASNATYGIIFPYFLNNGVSGGDRLFFTGYHWGAYVSDHCNVGEMTSVFCWYALKYENGTPGNAAYRGHDAIIKHLQVEQCPYGINVTGESGLHVNLYSAERDVSGNWYQTTGNDVDFTGAGVSGTVDIDAIDMTNVGVPDYTITSNDYNRFKLRFNNGHKVDGFVQTPASASSITLNMVKGKNAVISLTANTTLTITNAAAGDVATIEVVQDGTGGWTLTPTNNGYSNTGFFTPNPLPTSGTLYKGLYDGVVWLWDNQNITGLPGNNPATAFLASLNAAGYSAGGTEATGYQSFYTSAVSHGYWSKIKTMYTFSGTTTGTQAINFVNPATYLMTWSGSATSRTAGFQGNGSTGYGNTGFTPSAVLSTNSGALTAWSTTNSATSWVGIGGYSGVSGDVPAMQINENFDGSNTASGVGGANESVAIANPADYSGCFTISRISATSQNLYRNGSSLGSNVTSTAIGMPAVPSYVGARNPNNGGADHFSPQNYIFFILSDGLTSTDVSNLYTDLTALKTAMGR